MRQVPYKCVFPHLARQHSQYSCSGTLLTLLCRMSSYSVDIPPRFVLKYKSCYSLCGSAGLLDGVSSAPMAEKGCQQASYERESCPWSFLEEEHKAKDFCRERTNRQSLAGRLEFLANRNSGQEV